VKWPLPRSALCPHHSLSARRSRRFLRAYTATPLLYSLRDTTEVMQLYRKAKSKLKDSLWSSSRFTIFSSPARPPGSDSESMTAHDRGASTTPHVTTGAALVDAAPTSNPVPNFDARWLSISRSKDAQVRNPPDSCCSLTYTHLSKRLSRLSLLVRCLFSSRLSSS